MYSLQIPNANGTLVEIDAHDTCEGAIDFMLAVWHEDTTPPAYAVVAGPSGRVLAVLRPALYPGVVVVTRKGGSITFHAVEDAPLITID